MNKYKIAIVADIHYFSEKLGITGKAYYLRQSSDQKCLGETGAITDAAFDLLAKSDCDAVFIAGDISNDGEKVSHEEMREKIAVLNKSKPVYVVYATHDWCCDGKAKRFDGDKYYNDVETMTPPELREFYAEYGKDRAYDEYVTHLGSSSYAVKLNDNVRFLGLNDDQDGKGHSGYTSEHLEWILSQVKDAKKNGETVIIMEHHLVLENLAPMINSGHCIGDRHEMAEALASAGADFVIVGHSHMQRTTSYTAKNGNVMTQINVGALTGYPAPIVYLTVDDNEYKIDVEHLKEFTYKDEKYTSEFLKEHTAGVLTGIINAAINDKSDFLDRMGSIGIDIKPLEKHYSLIKKVSKFANTVSVGKAGRIVNDLTFGKGVDRKAVKQIKNDNLMNHIVDIFLSVFDGSLKKYGKDNPVYIIVKDVASLPIRISKRLPVKALKKENVQNILKQIVDIAEELTNPSEPDNQHCVIKR